MEIIKKIIKKQENLHESRQPVIAFLGDSVTQGCYELFMQDGRIKPATRASEGYSSKVKELLELLYPTVPVNIINAGISGDSAFGGLRRLERDVLSYKPDLVVVCFGINDSGLEADGLERYKESLAGIFDGIKSFGAEIIFMTPSLKTDVVDEVMEEPMEKIALDVARNEREGWLEKYISEAKKICAEKDVTICDCHRKWMLLRENKVNINGILSNKINHPVEKMHWLFAYELVSTMFEK